MGKSGKQLLLLVLVLVILVGVLFGVKQYNKVQSEKPEENSQITLADTPKEEILRLTYDYEGETYSFEKKEDTWYYTGDPSLTITQYMITNMLSKLSPLTAEQAIEEVTDVSQYGLGENSRTITWETADESYTIEVGDYNSMTAVEYIKFLSENTVYTVPSSTVTVFDKSLEDLVEETEEESD